MPKLSNIDRMAPSERSRFDAIIRSHNFYHLDAMVAALRKDGLHVSRSALNRHVQKLSMQQAAPPCEVEKPNLLVFVNRTTGHTSTIYTAATAAQIEAKISGVDAPD